MSEVTQILNAARDESPLATARLLPLVYDELRRIAAFKMTAEAANHTLQPTALVHEVWLRLGAGDTAATPWQSRAHFFAAAAEAMRRILVDSARRRQSQKRGANARHVELEEDAIVLSAPPDELLAVHEALDHFARHDPQAAELVKLRYFAGLTMDEAASTLGVSKRTAEGLWTYSRAWLHRAIRSPGVPPV